MDLFHRRHVVETEVVLQQDLFLLSVHWALSTMVKWTTGRVEYLYIPGVRVGVVRGGDYSGCCLTGGVSGGRVLVSGDSGFLLTA